MEESIKEKLRKPRFFKVKKISKEEFLNVSKENLKETLSKDIFQRYRLQQPFRRNFEND